jgi:hypothetical protein
MAGQPQKRASLAVIEKVGEEEILERISAGESVRAIAESIGAKQGHLNKWLLAPERSAQYARAREERASALAEEALTIADEAKDDPRLRVDTRKWFASRLDPKQWAENRAPVVAINIDSQAWHAIRQAEALTIDAAQQD